MKTFYKQLRLVIALFFYVLAIGVTPASAIGLGEIQLHSYLNDPLSASVELAVSPQETVEVGCIRLTPPSTADESSASLAYLREARLRLEAHGEGKLLQISTRMPVVEPILSVVLQVDCPGTGRILREYTLLLDPPLPRSLQPAYAKVPTPPRRDSVRVGSKASPQHWRVRRGETLSKIAADLSPGNRRAQQRLIEEIVALNPSVFPDGDPNRLPAGARLQLPDAHGNKLVVAATVSRSQEVVSREERAAKAPSAVAQSDTNTPRLTLSTGAQTATREAAAETARMVADTRELILETEAQYANAEALKSRLQRLEKQIVLLERALTSIDRLTELDATQTSVDTPQETQPKDPVTMEKTTSSTVAMVAPELVKKSNPPVQVPVSAAEQPVTVADQPPVSYWWWLVAFLGLGAVVLWLRAHRRDEQLAEVLPAGELGLDDLVPEPASAAGHGTLEERAPELAHRSVAFSDDPLAGLPDEPDTSAAIPPAPADPSLEVPVLDHQVTQQMEQGLLLDDFDFQERDIDTSREVNNILVRAEFHTLLKQPESAIRLLRESIDKNDTLRAEPALWLMLLRVCRQEGDRETFAELSQDFVQLFNIAVPKWEEARMAMDGETSTLEQDFPRLLNRVVSLWNTPNCALFLDSLLLDDREGTRRGFDINVAEELLLLKGVLRARG